jgi:hypothetical protein
VSLVQAKARDYLKKQTKKAKRTGDVVQVVKPLPSKCEALSSIPGTARKKPKKKTWRASPDRGLHALHSCLGSGLAKVTWGLAAEGIT